MIAKSCGLHFIKLVIFRKKPGPNPTLSLFILSESNYSGSMAFMFRGEEIALKLYANGFLYRKIDLMVHIILATHWLSGTAKIRTQECRVGSANPSSVSCCPMVKELLKLIWIWIFLWRKVVLKQVEPSISFLHFLTACNRCVDLYFHRSECLICLCCWLYFVLTLSCALIAEKGSHWLDMNTINHPHHYWLANFLRNKNFQQTWVDIFLLQRFELFH